MRFILVIIGGALSGIVIDISTIESISGWSGYLCGAIVGIYGIVCHKIGEKKN